MAKKNKILDRLQPDEAHAVLLRLLEAHPKLRSEVEEIATVVIGGSSAEAVAEDLVTSVELLDYEDLNSRSGGGSYGYVGPGEAAWELLQEQVQPWMDDMVRHVELGTEEDALEICKGLLLGLYGLQDVQGNDVLGWAPDFATETSEAVVALWTRGTTKARIPPELKDRKRSPFPRALLDAMIPEWAHHIERQLTSAGVVLK